MAELSQSAFGDLSTETKTEMRDVLQQMTSPPEDVPAK
jgi:hypothetical protein